MTAPKPTAPIVTDDLKRLARALCKARGIDPDAKAPFPSMSKGLWKNWHMATKDVLDIIDALREASPVMEAAGDRALRDATNAATTRNGYTIVLSRTALHAMLDAVAPVGLNAQLHPYAKVIEIK